MSHLPEPAAPFPLTRWSLVVSSHGQDAAALEELCRLYWQPLYSFCRRSGLNIEDAEDVTQRFFLDLLKDRATLLAEASRVLTPPGALHCPAAPIPWRCWRWGCARRERPRGPCGRR